MNWLHLVSYFFGGVFLANAVPHLATECRDMPSRAPSPHHLARAVLLNRQRPVGTLQLAVGYLLVFRVGHFDGRSTSHVLVLAVGALIISLQSARHFGQFHGGNTPGSS